MLDNCYSTGIFTQLADEDVVCEHCVDKLVEEGTKPEAARKQLAEKLVGQNVYRVGKAFLCKECVKEIYDNMYADEEALASLSDEDLAELDETVEAEAPAE